MDIDEMLLDVPLVSIPLLPRDRLIATTNTQGALPKPQSPSAQQSSVKHDIDSECLQHDVKPISRRMSSARVVDPENEKDAERQCLDRPPGKRDRLWIVARIEQIFELQLDSLLANDCHLSISLKSRTPTCQISSLPPVTSFLNTPDNDDALECRTFRYPGKSEQEAWRYTVTLRILELIHEALVSEVVITKRDIYYRDPALFSKQSVVDRFLDDLACTFGVSRMLLNVAATAKGLIAGAFTIAKPDGRSFEGLSERDGTLISRLEGDEMVDMHLVKWVLVVEKEATFHSLVRSTFWENQLSHGIIATGKGYPDISTRALLRFLTIPSTRNNMHYCPVYGLMDYDSDGIQILSTYKYGSKALAHENADLVLPFIRWIGVDSSHIGQEESHHQAQGLLKISAHDRRKATRMLEREPFIEWGAEPEWRREVQIMLMLNMKAEIQVLEAGPNGLQGWLKRQRLFE